MNFLWEKAKGLENLLYVAQLTRIRNGVLCPSFHPHSDLDEASLKGRKAIFLNFLSLNTFYIMNNLNVKYSQHLVHHLAHVAVHSRWNEWMNKWIPLLTKTEGAMLPYTVDLAHCDGCYFSCTSSPPSLCHCTFPGILFVNFRETDNQVHQSNSVLDTESGEHSLK